MLSSEVTQLKIKDAVVLVTGANRGLGRALVDARFVLERAGFTPQHGIRATS